MESLQFHQKLRGDLNLVIASAAKQSSDTSWFSRAADQSETGSLDCFIAALLTMTNCFAALAMTIRRTGSEVCETAWHYPSFGPDIQTNTGDAG